MTFHVGQRVVCIDASRMVAHHCERLPVQGEVYTIRDIIEWPGGTGLQFHEIVNSPKRYPEGFIECDFVARRFRPVKTTSISIFTQMLFPVSKDEGEAMEDIAEEYALEGSGKVIHDD